MPSPLPIDTHAAELAAKAEAEKKQIIEIIETLRLRGSAHFDTRPGTNLYKQYIQKYTQAFICPWNEDEADFNRYLRLRAAVAIDWAQPNLPGFKSRLALRLAYDLKHPEPLSPWFIFKMLEHLFNNKYIDNILFASAVINRMVLAMDAVFALSLTIPVLVLLAAGWTIANPVALTAIFVGIVELALTCVGLEGGIRYLYNEFNVKHKFSTQEPLSFWNVLIGIEQPSEHSSARSEALYPHSNAENAIADRHLRPYDRLGLFRNIDGVSKYAHAVADQSTPAMAAS